MKRLLTHSPVFLVTMLLVVPSTAFAQDQSPFDRMDRNGDGKLTRDELPAALRPNFDRVDTDGDGFISREEDAAFLERRRNSARRTQQNQRQPRVPDSISVDRNIAYAGTDNPRQSLDLLLPKQRQSDQPLPLLVFIHGGGWRAGDKAAGIRNLVPYMESGRFAGATIGYRLSDEAKWPSQIHDCKAAIRWLRANASEYGINADRIAVWGSSAGGHLVAMLGTSGDVEAMDGPLGPHADVSSRVACVVDYFGPTNFLTMNATAIPGARLDHDAANSPESILIDGPIQEHPERVATANPITYVTPDDPPFLIIHGTDDPLVSVNQSELLRDALQQADCNVVMIPVTGGGHGGFRNPRVNETVDAFLRRHLLGEDVEISAEPIPDGG